MKTQPDDLTEEQLIQCALSAGFGHDPKQNTLWVTGPTEVQVTRGLRDFARAVLAIRQAAQHVKAPVADAPKEWRDALIRLAFAAKNSIQNCGPDPLLKAAINQACLLLHDNYNYTDVDAAKNLPEQAQQVTDEQIGRIAADFWLCSPIKFARAVLSLQPSAAISAKNDVAYWEWRYQESNPHAPNFGAWSEWKRVEPRSALHTVDDALAEFRTYIAQGYKYELRALYARTE